MNAIIEAIAAIDPNYQITNNQMDQINSAKDPEKVAEWLASRVQDVQNDAARHLGIDPSLITKAEALATLKDLDTPTKGSSGDDEMQAYRLGMRVILRLGKASVAMDAPTTAQLVNQMFVLSLDRHVRAGGLAYYSNQIDSGERTPRDVMGELWESPEAKALRAAV